MAPRLRPSSPPCKTWLDRAGNFFSEAAHLVERYTRTGHDTMVCAVTIDDPKVYTRPWTMSVPLYRRLDQGMRLLEYKCVEFTQEPLYGHLRRKAK